MVLSYNINSPNQTSFHRALSPDTTSPLSCHKVPYVTLQGPNTEDKTEHFNHILLARYLKLKAYAIYKTSMINHNV